MIGSLLCALLTLQGTVRDSTVRFPRGSRLSIVTVGEAVQVRVGSGDVVSYRGADVHSTPLGNTPGAVTLGITPTIRGGGNSQAPVVITIPSWAEAIVTTNGGDITFEGTIKELTIQTTTGTTRVDDGGGKATIKSIAGPVTVSRFQGSDLSIDAPGGNIGIYTAFGKVHATSVNGSITLRAILSMEVAASTTNGQIQIDGPFASDGEYMLESHVGAITVFAPVDFSARVTTKTFTGKFLDEYNSRQMMLARTAPPPATASLAGGSAAGGRGGQRTASVQALDADATERANRETTAPGVSREIKYGTGETHFILNSFSGVITVRRATGQ